MNDRRLDRRLRGLLLVVLAPAHFLDLSSDALSVGDESYWTYHAWTAVGLLRRGELDHPFWTLGLEQPVLTGGGAPLHMLPPTRVPKLGLFLIGASLHASGAPPPRLVEYHFLRSLEWNRREGRLPPPATLAAARAPGALLGLLGALWLFSALRTVVAPGWAAIGALLLGLDPLSLTLNRRAMLDAPAFAFSIAAVLWTLRAVERPDRFAPVLAAALAGAAAVSSKLNAGILLPLIAAALAIEGALRRRLAPLGHGLAAGLCAALLFVALDPTLHAAPLRGVASMARVGSELSRIQEFGEGPQALRSVPARTRAAARILLGTGGPLGAHLGVPLDAPLLLVGLGALGVRVRERAAARVLLLWLAVAVTAVCLWPPLALPRYFLPALAPLVAVETAGLAAVGSGLLRLGRRFSATVGAPR